MVDIDKHINSIESGNFSQRELIALYNNRNKNSKVTDLDRERLVSSLVLRLRNEFPRAANVLLGRINARPLEVLEELYANANSKFNLSENTLDNGVKVGGPKGAVPVDLYISYKDADKNGVVAGAIQLSNDKPIIYRVFRYTGAARPECQFDEVQFLGEAPEFEVEYFRLLNEVLRLAA